MSYYPNQNFLGNRNYNNYNYNGGGNNRGRSQFRGGYQPRNNYNNQYQQQTPRYNSRPQLAPQQKRQRPSQNSPGYPHLQSSAISPNSQAQLNATHKLKSDVLVGAISKYWPTDDDLKYFKEALRPPRSLLFSTNDSKVFTKNTVDTKLYQVRSTLIALDQEWFDDKAILNHDDAEILDDTARDLKDYNTLYIEILDTLNRIKSLFKAPTNFVILDGHVVFRSQVAAAATLLGMVLVDINPINSRDLESYEVGPVRTKRLINICKEKYKYHYKDCSTTTSTVLSPENAVSVDNL